MGGGGGKSRLQSALVKTTVWRYQFKFPFCETAFRDTAISVADTLVFFGHSVFTVYTNKNLPIGLAGNVVFLKGRKRVVSKEDALYFPSVGRGVTLAPRNSPPTNKLSDGHRDLESLLLVDEEISPNPE